MNNLDNFANTVFGWWDNAVQGVQGALGGYFDTKYLFENGESLKALEQSQAQAQDQIEQYTTGNEASNWSNPYTSRNTGTGGGNLTDLSNPQNILILAGVGLVIFAIARK